MSNKAKEPINVLEITGTIGEIFETKQITKDFCIREFIVETQGQYPNAIKFQVINEKCHDFKKYNSTGDNVRVLFDVRGRKSDSGQYWNSLVAYFIEMLEKADKQESEDLPF